MAGPKNVYKFRTEFDAPDNPTIARSKGQHEAHSKSATGPIADRLVLKSRWGNPPSPSVAQAKVARSDIHSPLFIWRMSILTWHRLQYVAFKNRSLAFKAL